MRVLLAPLGSRGDVQPMVALGRGLRAAGHEPVFCVTKDFSALMEQEKFVFHVVDVDAQKLAQSTGSKVYNPFVFSALIRDLLERTGVATLKAMEGADVVVGGGAQVLAPSLCEKHGIPYLFAAYSPPMLRSRIHPPITMPWARGSARLNAVLWAINAMLANGMLRRTVNGLRRKMGLPRVRDIWSMITHPSLVLGVFDAQLAAPPSDVGEGLKTTGFWFLEDETPLSPEVEAFLGAGSTPFYIGFGSMPHDDPKALGQRVMDAVRAAGVRAVIGSGWAELGRHGPVPPECLVVNNINHGALFPRMAGVVHHGGAGTTSTAARAGVPQLVVPHLMDQFYWGHRVSHLGVGPAPVPARRLNATNLAAALTAMGTQASYRAAAQQLATSLRGAPGVKHAVDVIEAAAKRPAVTGPATPPR